MIDVSSKIDSRDAVCFFKVTTLAFIITLTMHLPCIAAGTGIARQPFGSAAKGVSVTDAVQVTQFAASSEQPYSEPMLNNLSSPVYKKLCRLETLKRYALHGTMVIRVFIDPTGTPVQMGVVQSLSPLLDEEVLTLLIQETRFKPAVMSGKPVASSFLMKIKFE
jgi:outer membrane biosynthesis protein TonB